jgi:hypothetical protein
VTLKLVYKYYASGEEIPFLPHIKNRKLVKYYTRETMAAMVALGELCEGSVLPADTPFFYSSGELKLMDYFKEVCDLFTGEEQQLAFSGSYFIEKVMPRLSPLSQFKIMRNMCYFLCSFELGLKGENALFLDSLQGLLYSARFCEYQGPALIGAGNLYADGASECGFALVSTEELDALTGTANAYDEPLAFFKHLYNRL